jgi:pyruvate,water dikinase
VYDGALPFSVEHTDLAAIQRPRTKIMINVGNPDEAFTLSFLPNDGVGLARIEFIISNAIGIHPMALVKHAELAPDVRAHVDRLTEGYVDKPRSSWIGWRRVSPCLAPPSIRRTSS